MTSNITTHRPPKMARLTGPERIVVGKTLIDLSQAFKEKIAGYLRFEEAFCFVGKTLSFTTWLERRGGIDDTDSWTSRKVVGDKWDRLVFPKMLGKIEKHCTSQWCKSLKFAQASHGQLSKFSSFTFPHLERLSLNFFSREIHKPSIVLQRALTNFSKNCPKLAHIQVSVINERECQLLLDNCKSLVSLKICTIDFLPNSQNGKLSRWDWKECAKKITDHPTLKAVYLENKVLPHEVKHVAKIPQVKSLFFWNDPALVDEDLAPLASCKNLEEVGLRNLPKITHAAVETLLKLPQLTSLSIEKCESLILQESRINECQLQRLTLTTCAYTDAFLKFLPYCPSLARVTLTNCAGLSDEGLAMLGKCKELRDLEIVKGSPNISDKGLVSLAACPLRVLKLKLPPVDARQMKTEQTAWKNITIIGVRKLVEQSPELRLFETPLPQLVVSFPHTDKELLKNAILSRNGRLQVAFLA